MEVLTPMGKVLHPFVFMYIIIVQVTLVKLAADGVRTACRNSCQCLTYIMVYMSRTPEILLL